MFANNPFADLATVISPGLIQAYVVLMFVLVVGGTIIDMIHKKSATYFFDKAEKAKASRERELSGGEKNAILIKTIAHDVLTSGEFCSQRRRVSHLFTMYGFVTFIATTIVMVFGFPTSDTPAPTILPLLWHLGALMVCFGGYWFWFFIRVDVSAEGVPWYRIVRADMFILSLLGTTTFGFLWSIFQAAGAGALTTVCLALFIIASAVLFGGVLWSKFAHMFFKPAAAYQKRIIKADGSRENLPDLGDLTDPALQKKFPDIPEYMGTTPAYMGLGIKREKPRHY